MPYSKFKTTEDGPTTKVPVHHSETPGPGRERDYALSPESWEGPPKPV